MADNKYTAPNDFRAFAESLGETEATLCHHGVKGQRWGVRRFQDKNGRLTAEGRKRYGYGPARKGKHGDAGGNENAQDDSDRKIAEITKNYEFNREYTLRDPLVKKAISVAKAWDAGRSNELHTGEEENRSHDLKSAIGRGAAIGAAVGSGRGLGVATASIISENKMIDDYNKYVKKGNVFTVNQFGKTAHDKLESRLTNDQMAGRLAAFGVLGAAGGAALGAGVGGIVHGVRAHNAKRANENLSRVVNEIYQNPNVDKKTGLKTKMSIMSPDDDMAKVNPGFKNWSDGTKSNCLICTATYALRRKGFDVTANGANDGYDTTAMLQAFPKASMRRVQLPKTNKNGELASALNMPDGSFGNMSVNWKNGGGHSMVVSVEGGKVVIRDTQSNKIYRGFAVNKILARTTGEAKIIRLDNADPDIAQMKKMGMINPLGQSFKVDPKAVVQGVAGTGQKSGKHGDTGF